MNVKYENFLERNFVRIGQAMDWKEISSISGEANGEKRYGIKGEDKTYSESEICGIALEEVVSKGKKWIEVLGFKKNNANKENSSDIDTCIDFYYYNGLVWKYIEKREKIVNEETILDKSKNIWIRKNESTIELLNNNGDLSQSTIKYSIKHVHSLQNFLADNPNPEYGKVDFHKIYEQISKKV